MPLNTSLRAALPRSTDLPSVAAMTDDLAGAMSRFTVDPSDRDFVTSLCAAARSNRATFRQLEWLERLWNRYCDPIPLPAETQQAMELVAGELYRNASPARQTFIRDILRACRMRSPSDAQWGAFLGLVNEAQQAGVAAAVEQAVINDATADRVDATRLFSMFRSALSNSTGVTSPRLRFPGLNVWLSQRGDTAGHLMLTRPHTDPARRARLARVLPDGRVVGGFNHRPSMLSTEQRQLLNRLCETPEETLANEGRRTGMCCMCGRGLTDERSVNLGMGPVCAARWGLSSQWLSARGVSPTARAPRGATTGRLSRMGQPVLPSVVVQVDPETIERRTAPWRAVVTGSSPVGDMLRQQQQPRGPVVNGEIVPNSMLSPSAPNQEDF